MNRRWPSLLLAIALLTAACGDDDSTDTSSAPPGTDASTTDDTAAPAASTTTTVVAATTQTAAVPPTIDLENEALAMEPPDVSYRAQLQFEMHADLGGEVQEGIVVGDGGKLTDPDQHSFVVAVEGLTTIPGCFDLASGPSYVSAYHTFYGGLSGDTGGDLTGEAQLLAKGITTNGVLVDRYGITLDNIQPSADSEYTEFSEAYIDIARDGGFVVALVMSGTGRNNSFSVDQTEPRDIIFELTFSEFGTYEEFTRPDGCPAP